MADERLIAVTGATGGLGGRVAHRLAKAGANQRLVVRDPARAPAVGADVVVASYYRHWPAAEYVTEQARSSMRR